MGPWPSSAGFATEQHDRKIKKGNEAESRSRSRDRPNPCGGGEELPR